LAATFLATGRKQATNHVNIDHGDRQPLANVQTRINPKFSNAKLFKFRFVSNHSTHNQSKQSVTSKTQKLEISLGEARKSGEMIPAAPVTKTRTGSLAMAAESGNPEEEIGGDDGFPAEEG